MNRFIVLPVCLVLLLVSSMCYASDPPADPFAALVEATAQLNNMAAALKPASENVAAKQEAVTSKEAELAAAQTEHVNAKTAYNQALADFIAAIDALKEAAAQIPQANGDNPAPTAAKAPAAAASARGTTRGWLGFRRRN